MQYKLINEPDKNLSTIEQVLVNRGIKKEGIPKYVNTTWEDVNPPEALGEENMIEAAAALTGAILNNEKVLVVVDSDCDGFTSSALLINYLHERFPSFVENNLDYFLHEGKQHGLNDCYQHIINDGQYSVVITPDSASNDYEEHKALKEAGIDIIILDHHEAEKISEDAITINNQLSDYPNKEFSGVGVTWQFCRYLDSKLGEPAAAYNLLDLVALGLTADMVSLRELETRHLILEGFKEENIKNPFIYHIAKKNSFSLGDEITSIGAAFYISPFVNAMVRSGTHDEKELLFNSMLKHKAFEKVLSNKRGHKLGEEEYLFEQALRTATNVKNRQTKAQNEGMDFLNKKIESENLLNNKVLLFQIQSGQIDRNIAGLVANKLMAKYQRPCCVLTKVRNEKGDFLQGSSRGYDKSGVTNFKDICENFPYTDYAQGHQSAFGLSIPSDKANEFLEYTNKVLENMSSSPVYLVDYIYEGSNVEPSDILDIANMKFFWGKDIDESKIAVEGLVITKDMVTLMSPDKRPTLKISLPNGVALIKFHSSQEEYGSFCSNSGYKKFNIVGKCNENKWNGHNFPQILIEDYELVDSNKYFF